MESSNCLLARRLIERGSRFVQLYHTNWDRHGGSCENLNSDFEKVCKDVDQASAALVLDLKGRGILEDTLLLGFDHEQLTYRFHGKDFLLTDVHGKIVKQILA